MAYLAYSEVTDSVFVLNLPYIKFGMGASKEVGYEARRLGITSALLVVGKRLAETKLAEQVRSSLESQGIRVEVFTDVHIEPEDEAIVEGYRKIKDLRVDGFVALGGGSTIDTAKLLNLLYTYPADLMEYVNRPIGKGASPPGPLKPMIAIPTTAGTGAENTNVAVLDIKRLHVKTGVSNQYLRPSVAIVDPLTTVTMPPMVTASTGLDVLNHAIESITAHPYTARPAVPNPAERPVYAGSTPIGDLFAPVIGWVAKYIRRAYADPYDLEARYYLHLGAGLAGLGFGHAGVHVPHAMAYPIAGLVREWHPPDYDFGYPIVPHGISTAIPAAYAFRYLAPYNDEKFRLVARQLGLDDSGAPRQVGERIFDFYMKLLEDLHVPTNLREIGFTRGDLDALVEGAWAQQRLLVLSPKTISKEDLRALFAEML
ncbi:MAG: Alcohol dehydrogenase, class IV [uncultured Acidilobus sp. CIS]|nr:MAG: Alcohol dehydrogenase, class IV [uncultured Acidilobus sp. CIS]